tara:strand:- start:365 stop:613 length:249 start_codon:yes stop_codon:yes gene_type:complete
VVGFGVVVVGIEVVVVVGIEVVVVVVGIEVVNKLVKLLILVILMWDTFDILDLLYWFIGSGDGVEISELPSEFSITSIDEVN